MGINSPRQLFPILTCLLILGLSGISTAQQSSGQPGVIERPSPSSDNDNRSQDGEAQGNQDSTNERPQNDSPSNSRRRQQQNNNAQNNTETDDGSSGPPVLSPEDLSQGGQAIDNNFPENFDPFDPPRNLKVNIDFDQADLHDVVIWISALTGQNFIIADTISSSKKITIISPQPVSINEAYRAFIAALSMNGLTVVPFGRFLKIVEAESAARQPTNITTRRSQIRRDDRMVTHIHQLDHVSIDTVMPVLEALTSEAASIVEYNSTNSLIITETGTNLRRILSVLERLDVPSGQEKINLYQVQYAKASELKDILLELFKTDEDSSAAQPSRRRRRRRGDNEAEQTEETASPSSVAVSKIIADERTNQLIVISTKRSFERMMGIIKSLDVPIPGEGQIHVISLENAKAAELASTLQSLTQSIEEQREEESSGRQGRQTQNQTEGESGPASATLSGDVSITADESTNSLVVVASLRDFITLERVVDELDQRREQVYVEAVVMEVSLDRNQQFGIWLHGGSPVGIEGADEDGAFAGRTAFNEQSSLLGLASLASPSTLQGLALGFQGPEIEIAGVSLPSFGALLQALQTDSDVNVLSTPHLLTMDNEEAEIVVGENIPIPSSVSTLGGLGGLGNLSGLLNQSGDQSGLGALGALGGLGGLGGQVNIQRQDVALTLKIRPQVNSSDYVRLEIEQQIDDVKNRGGEYGPTTTTRQIRTVVAVEDQQTVVLGGLMRDTKTKSTSKTPILGDIPILGHLFRRTSSRTQKSNLLLLLTPYIIRDPQDFQAIFRRKMQEREEFIAYFGRDGQDYVRSVDYARKDGPMQAMFNEINTSMENEARRRRAYGTNNSEQSLELDSQQPFRLRINQAASSDEPEKSSSSTEHENAQSNDDEGDTSPSNSNTDETEATPDEAEATPGETEATPDETEAGDTDSASDNEQQAPTELPNN